MPAAFDDKQRRSHVIALEARGEAWVLPKVRELEMDAEDYDLASIRLRLGDRAVLNLDYSEEVFGSKYSSLHLAATHLGSVVRRI